MIRWQRQRWTHFAFQDNMISYSVKKRWLISRYYISLSLSLVSRKLNQVGALPVAQDELVEHMIWVIKSNVCQQGSASYSQLNVERFLFRMIVRCILCSGPTSMHPSLSSRESSSSWCNGLSPCMIAKLLAHVALHLALRCCLVDLQMWRWIIGGPQSWWLDFCLFEL